MVLGKFNFLRVAYNVVVFPDPVGPEDLKKHHVAVGCENCYHTGYSGRKAIYEILPIGSELSVLIKNNQLDIDKYLEENEIFTLKKNALSLIKNGTTSIDEVFSLLL